MKILVSGGTGYIGSHTCVELLNKGYDVVAFDNLYNSKIDVVDRVEKITGKKLIFYKADMLDKESMRPIFEEHKFDAVIHFAALKAVGESVQKPLAYYKNNVPPSNTPTATTTAGTNMACTPKSAMCAKTVFCSRSVTAMYSAHQSTRCTLSLLMRSARVSAHHVKVFDDEHLQQLAEVTRGRDDAVGLLAAGLGAHVRDG